MSRQEVVIQGHEYGNKAREVCKYVPAFDTSDTFLSHQQLEYALENMLHVTCSGMNMCVYMPVEMMKQN